MTSPVEDHVVRKARRASFPGMLMWNWRHAGRQVTFSANAARPAGFTGQQELPPASGGGPDDALIPEAPYSWAYRDRKVEPPPEIAAALEWIAGHSRPLANLADQDLMLDVPP